VDATQPIDRPKTKVLECGTATEQALHVILGDVDGDELEVLKSREQKSRLGINREEMAVHEPGEAQRGREAEHGQRQRAHMSIIKTELLELI
jgi:hypothetical protein